MGSLRNPVGPLPSSIYWRRRAVLLSVLALLALLVAWVLTAGGGGGGNGADGSNGKNPVPSITPGPSGSGPAISEAPGGRDESGGDSAGTGGTGGTGGAGDTGGTGGTGGSGGPGSGGGSGTGGSGGSDGGSASGASSGGTGGALPAGSSLPDCTAKAVTLTLRSVRNSYSPDETPAFRLTAKNSSDADCEIDLGPKHTVLTISQATSDDTYWSSAHCPKGSGSLVRRVPANGSIDHTVKWDVRPSAPKCATPPAGSAGAGTYLVEAKPAGFAKVRTSFVLDAD